MGLRMKSVVKLFRIMVASVFVVFLLFSQPLQAGTTTYDMSTILFEKHPFATKTPARSNIAAPLPASRIRAPVRVPQPTIPERSTYRQAAKPSATQPLPNVSSRAISSVPPSSWIQDGLWGVSSEIRTGVLSHGTGPFASPEEEGVDANFEVLFNSVDFLKVIWSPRPQIGISLNSAGDTSHAYLGLSWELAFWDKFFAGYSLGATAHNGEVKTNVTDRNELVCRILFRNSFELGYRFLTRHSVSAFLEHMSNANICDKNEGLDSFGIRYGYLF